MMVAEEGQKTGEGGGSRGDGGFSQAGIYRSEIQGESGARGSLVCGMGWQRDRGRRGSPLRIRC